MRRALVLILASFAVLIVAGPTASAAEARIRNPEFTLREDGFLVTVKAASESTKIDLIVYRHGQVAYYLAPAEITEDSVKARFAQFGELDYTFTAAPGKRPKCKGGDGTVPGTFRGTFTFHGENDYLDFEADHAHGTFELFPMDGCKEPAASFEPPARPRRAGGPNQAAAAKEATLEVVSGKRPPAVGLIAFSIGTKKGVKVFLNAFRAEMTEGVLIERGVQVLAGLGSFRFDVAAGTARVEPPAPFSGWAELRPGRHGRSIWRGSLRMPVLGAQPARLTGATFKARLFGSSPLD
ncbi:MAG TPA: hypothetical protein VGI17_00765 [Solirubrobacterales bacterium]|jgi:hypothetical protein